MKKALVAFFLVMSVAAVAFANGNVERQTTIEGTVLLKADERGNVTLMVEQQNGARIEIAVTEQELEQLKLENRQQIKVTGVLIGETAEQRNQERLIARTMTVNSVEIVLKNQVQLTEQDRTQLRTRETEKKHLHLNEAETEIGTTTRTATGNASGTAQGTVSGIASDFVSGITSGSTSGSVSGSIPGIVSGSASGSTSGSTSGTASGSTSGHSSGSFSGLRK